MSETARITQTMGRHELWYEPDTGFTVVQQR